MNSDHIPANVAKNIRDLTKDLISVMEMRKHVTGDEPLDFAIRCTALSSLLSTSLSRRVLDIQEQRAFDDGVRGLITSIEAARN